MRRKQFLQEFLGALGAKDIHWNEETESSISGIVIYNFDDPEEIQEFIWHKHDSEAPTQEVLELATLLKAQRLLSIDKIMVSRHQLRQRFSTWLGRIVPEAEFLDILEALKSVEVPMVDEGRETDIYFIHE